MSDSSITTTRISSRAGIVWLLTGLNLLNYLDRYVVIAVSPRLQQALGLNDFETGAILSAFMLGYFLTSPIFGVLGDRFPRKLLITLGVICWSLATLGSGLVYGFVALLVARVFVGVGEASYATLSPTIIDDLTTPATKNRWLGLFYAAIPVGSALGFAVGGVLEHQWGWRSAFFVAGAPGILLALLVLFIVEPARPARTSAVRLAGAFATLARIPAYVATVLGYTAYSFALGGFAAWAPKLLVSTHDVGLATADFVLGILLAAAGFLGTAVGGWLGDRWPGNDRVRASLTVCALSTGLAIPAAVLALSAASATAFFVAFGVAAFLLFVSTAPTNAAILQSVPEHLRASAMAVSIFMIHLLGDLLSPPLIGKISDLADGRLQLAMLVLIPVAIVLAAVIWGLGARLPWPRESEV